MDEIVKQHLLLVSQIKNLSVLQTQIAQQTINNHEALEGLFKSLGVKKDLSYYSFNLADQQEH